MQSKSSKNDDIVKIGHLRYLELAITIIAETKENTVCILTQERGNEKMKCEAEVGIWHGGIKKNKKSFSEKQTNNFIGREDIVYCPMGITIRWKNWRQQRYPF